MSHTIAVTMTDKGFIVMPVNDPLKQSGVFKTLSEAIPYMASCLQDKTFNTEIAEDLRGLLQ